MKNFNRTDRVKAQMIRDISEYFDTELADKIKGMVTITYVKLSKDLRYASVYFSYLGEEVNRESVYSFMDRHKNNVRAYLGKVMKIRHIPEIIFKFDPSIEEGIRIEQLLHEINNDKRE
ncbi:MAG: 30S ribosome-binding factor RbfA [Candidatus Zixiibacteriota bacterium]|nr:MAG: 30S ribosome-binding factor RbfA [candidate division Zixibacteria bacterium]